MARLRDNELGCYTSSLFGITMDTDETDISFDGLKEEDQATLLHEYVHFLQDFGTVYGLTKISVSNHCLGDILNTVRESESSEILVPVKVCDGYLIETSKILKLAEGDISTIDANEISGISVDESISISNMIFPSVFLTINGDEVSFGAMAIMESMAYIMERCCSPNAYIKSPFFPYMAAEKVADFYVPNFSENLLMVLALCDVSLQYTNSGYIFVRIMEEIKKGEYEFTEPEEIYDVLQDVSFNSECGGVEVIDRNFRIFLKDTEELFKRKLASPSPQYNGWIDRLVEFAYNWRKKEKYFILEMARSGIIVDNKFLQMAWEYVGSPLISNKNGQYCLKIPAGMEINESMIFFRVFHNIENVLRYGNFECSLYQWCRQQGLPTNEFCHTAPWRVAGDSYNSRDHKNCPFCMIWDRWGLYRYHPVKHPGNGTY